MNLTDEQRKAAQEAFWEWTPFTDAGINAFAKDSWLAATALQQERIAELKWWKSKFCKDHLEDESWTQGGCPVCSSGRDNARQVDATRQLADAKNEVDQLRRGYGVVVDRCDVLLREFDVLKKLSGKFELTYSQEAVASLKAERVEMRFALSAIENMLDARDIVKTNDGMPYTLAYRVLVFCEFFDALKRDASLGYAPALQQERIVELEKLVESHQNDAHRAKGELVEYREKAILYSAELERRRDEVDRLKREVEKSRLEMMDCRNILALELDRDSDPQDTLRVLVIVAVNSRHWRENELAAVTAERDKMITVLVYCQNESYEGCKNKCLCCGGVNESCHNALTPPAVAQPETGIVGVAVKALGRNADVLDQIVIVPLSSVAAVATKETP